MLPFRAMIIGVAISLPMLVTLFGYYDHPLFMNTPLGAIKTACVSQYRSLTPAELKDLPQVLDDNPPESLETPWWFSQLTPETLIDAAATQKSQQTHSYLYKMTYIRQRRLAGYVAAKIAVNERMDCADILERLAVDTDCEPSTWFQSEMALRRFGRVRATQGEFDSWIASLQITGRHLPLALWIKQLPK